MTPEIPITSKSPEAIEFFKKGRDLTDNVRFTEATAALNQAIKADPDFALALAYQGIVTPGPRGLTFLEQASAKTNIAATAISKPVSVSKAERLFVEASLAGRRGEFAKSEDLWKQVTDAAPNDWRAYMARGQQLSASQKYPEAIDALNKAIAINPNAGPAHNTLAYVHLAKGDAAPAVEALKRYASLNPNEPNPHDSLGEAMMTAGDLAGAEAEFKQAASCHSAGSAGPRKSAPRLRFSPRPGPAGSAELRLLLTDVSRGCSEPDVIDRQAEQDHRECDRHPHRVLV